MAQATEINAEQGGDLSSFLKHYTPEEPLAYPRDMLAGHYHIHLNEPLAEFSSPFAKAFVAKDSHQAELPLYALVYDTAVPTRQKNIRALKQFRHPSLVAVLEDGIAEISAYSENRYVVILEKPAGQTLTTLLTKGKNPLSETFLIDFLLRPFVEILIGFNEMGISHNSINLDTVYLSGNHFMLGECISQPAGFSQPLLFEPVDRMLSSPYGKSNFAISADYYSLAMVALHLALGAQPFAALSPEKIINDVLAKGAYHAFAILWDFTDGLQDFFRGLLNDAHRERWDPKIIESWLAGKRFNLILPSLSQETSRGFEFAGETFYNRKCLAQSIFTHWQEARIFLFDTRMIRWIESNLHKPEMAQALANIALQSPGDKARAEVQNSDLLARMIIVLDTVGPLRYKNISTMVEGIDIYFAHSFINESPEEFESIQHIIDSDIAAFWIEQQKNPLEFEAYNARLQKGREFSKMTGMGFGHERCLYYFYPALPCLSPLIKKYHVTTLNDLLLALDMIASQKTMHENFMDRHIAAFIASKADIAVDMRIYEFDGIPGLATHPKCIALKFLLRAVQKTTELPPLPGLTAWVAFQLLPLLDNLHKHSLKIQTEKALKNIAAKGSLQKIADLIFDRQIFVADHRNFVEVSDTYSNRQQHIDTLKNYNLVARHARVAGRGIAQTIAYGICLTIIYLTLRSYIQF